MRTYLSLSWNVSMAIGEMSAAAIFIFSLLVSRHLFEKRILPVKPWTMPLLIALSILVAAVFGWVIGSAISSPGYGLGMIIPLATILQSVHYNRYSALGFLIGFQLLGAVIALGAFYLFKLVLPKQGSALVVVEPAPKTYAQTLVKSVIFQPLLIAALLLIPNLDLTAYDSGIVFNALLLALSLALMLFLSQYVNYLIISPVIGIVFWIKQLIARELTWAKLYHDVLEMSVQLVVAAPILAADVLVRMSQRVY